MKFETAPLAGVVICHSTVHGDVRGHFREVSRRNECAAAGMDMDIVQVNTSTSRPGVLRGMHYQMKHPQSKLVVCLSGAIFDVMVDCRPASPTFGKWFGLELSAENGLGVFVPEGFAHGLQVLGDVPATIVYQCNDYYRPGDEGGFHWASPAVGIAWPAPVSIVSARDDALPAFSPSLPFPELGKGGS
ncbi:MAG: dTDP-4-dehydrorhamnose 3,5-epimerase [Kiritimatiellia bacterium]|jgi:dTDP-4-dehydrorhamnose 3,5-epimerase